MRHATYPLARSIGILVLATGSACTDRSGRPIDVAPATEGASPAGTQGDADTGDATDSGAPGTARLDIAESTAAAGTCKVAGDLDAFVDCGTSAPPNSFSTTTQWTWDGLREKVGSAVIPLVANFTDDNGDHEVDLCDVPDVLLVTENREGNDPNLFLLDGASGQLHFGFSAPVNDTVTPAIGDIDDDGRIDVVTVSEDLRLMAFNHLGEVLWTQPTPISTDAFDVDHGAVALADLDNDGDVEIILGTLVADHEGTSLFRASDFFGPEAGPSWSDNPGRLSATAAADLDGDGDLEVVLGRSAWHHDGTGYFQQPAVNPGYPQIADLDDDPDPEILLTTSAGITILEHDGTIKFRDETPTGDVAYSFNWLRPATIHDFDGDAKPDFAVSSSGHYAAYDLSARLMWQTVVEETSCCAAGTAFDFLGDGVAEAMYADEQTLHVLDGRSGAAVLTQPRRSVTHIEYPVVVDVDNDRSAEILVVSNSNGGPGSWEGSTLEVFRDADDRWVGPRRIWNQHTYHVTNVREDGTIPQFESPSWAWLNTYRTNAQLEQGGVCRPNPVG